jgi:GrpB-like predicted nucleotidyltransferase (UPF0157 family)/quercetin dioxygenase-like cupin family protein
VKIVRFDEEVSLSVSSHGSRFRIGPLTSDDSRVRVQLMYLPPDGLIARHDAGARQMLAVVAGAGWVSGADGARRQVRAGWGALWDAGESHETGSPDGLTAICIEGEFESWAMSVTRDIVVADYDPAWPEWFEELHGYIWPAVSGLALRIDHVGSTSVPGLAAKPVIDMDIVVASDDGVRPVIDALKTIGYRWRGDLGVEGRAAFSRVTGAVAPELPEHHLYLVVENNKAHLDHWLLRDLLRGDADARALYAGLKRRNAEVADRDMDFYVAAKAELVAELLTRARAERGLPPAEYWRSGES